MVFRDLVFIRVIGSEVMRYMFSYLADEPDSFVSNWFLSVKEPLPVLVTAGKGM